MKIPFDIYTRTPIWVLLSELYLDCQLSNADYNYIANKIIESPYSFQEVFWINKYEIFPVLKSNLLNGVGVWSGFDENWLVDTIMRKIENRTKINELISSIEYWLLRWVLKEEWQALESEYDAIKKSN
jgi:hypothetical protein